MDASVTTISVLCILLLSFLWPDVAISGDLVGLRSATFSMQPLCDMQLRLHNNCMSEVSQGQSLMKCCRRCLSDNECVGASVHLGTKKCYLHSQCSVVPGCSSVDNDYEYGEKVWVSTRNWTLRDPLPCVYGSWDTRKQKCVCNYGRAGELCDRIYYDCLEIGEYAPQFFYHYFHGIYIRPRNYSQSIAVRCLILTEYVHTYMMRNRGTLNFNRTWDEYLDTFRTPRESSGSYWMGLEHMRFILGPRGRTVFLEYRFDIDGRKFYTEHSYTDFRLGDASTNFMLTYSSHQITREETIENVTIGDCLALSNMTQFSTIDVDNDDDPDDDCAKKANAAWWFSSCNFACNPLGAFRDQTPAPPTEDGYIRFPGVGLDEQFMRDHLVHVYMFYKDDII